MALSIRPIEYFYATVRDKPGVAHRFLSELAAAEVNLLAFNIVPVGLEQTQLILFPDSSEHLTMFAEHRKINISGPQRAFLVQGDDQLGALVELHRVLAEAKINVYASSGVTDGSGCFGYILYVRDEDFEKARQALKL